MMAAGVGFKNPYPGLRPFEPEESDYFFGRERQVDELLVRLRDHRFVAVLGLSGSGKSSLVRAGLVPALQAGHLVSSGSRWRVALMRPGSHPMAALTAALDGALGARAGRRERLERSTNSLLAETREGREAGESLLVVVDQFEELFRAADAREAATFVDLLLAAEQALAPEHRVYVVLTMRTDRVGECAAFEGLPEALNRSQYLVPRLTGEELREAIAGPAALTDTEIAPELLQALVVEAGAGRDTLPLLQHLLMTLWEKRERGSDGWSRIGLGEYEAAGSAAAALNARADRVLAELPEPRRAVAARMFRALVDVGVAKDQRRPRRLSELAAEAGAAEGDVRAVAEHFFAAGLLTSPDRGRVEDWEADITHESLIRQWGTLGKWVEEEAKDSEDYRYFAERARRARVTGWAWGGLGGSDLSLARRWLAKQYPAAWAVRYGGDFEGTCSYIRRSVWVERIGMAAAGILCLVILGLAGWAWWSSVRAREAQRTAVVAREEAVRQRRSAEERAGEARRQKVMADTAAKQARLAESEARAQVVIVEREREKVKEGLAQSLVQDGLRLQDAGKPEEAMAYFARGLRTAPHSGPATSWVSDLLLNTVWWSPAIVVEHAGEVQSAAFSADGRKLVTGSQDKTVRLWDAETGKASGPVLKLPTSVFAELSPDGRRVLTVIEANRALVWDSQTGSAVGNPLAHKSLVIAAGFSGDGRRVVTSSRDGTARVWNAETGEAVTQSLPHRTPRVAAEFSSDGRLVMTGVSTNAAQVWNVESGLAVGAPIKHEDNLTWIAFSPDGRRVLTASLDRTARISDAETGKQVGPPLKHQHPPLRAVFSPDGRLVLTVSDNLVLAWSAESGDRVGFAMAHPISVGTAAFSPDSERIITTAGNAVRVWDAESGLLMDAPLAHPTTISFAAFSPDGRRVVTTSADRWARIWARHEAAKVRLRHTHWVAAATFSPDSKRVLTGSHDGTARIWDRASGKPLGVAMSHSAPVLVAAFSPDGDRVATGARNTAQLWEAGTGRPLGVKLEHTGRIVDVMFSPDGRRLVTASSDYTAQIWDAQTGKPVGAALTHENPVTGAVFSPNGQRVVTASRDHTAQVWDATTGQRVGVAMRHKNAVYEARFSPDGRWIVTASEDNTARTWDANTGRPTGVVMKHGERIHAARFSPDGKRVVTASYDTTARIWDAQSGKPLGAPMTHGSTVRTAAFAADGKRVLTAGGNSMARVWDAETGKPLGQPLRHEGTVVAAAFSPDGRWIVTASDDNTAGVWGSQVECCASQKEADRLASLAETVSLHMVSERGAMSAMDLEEYRRRVAELRKSVKKGARELTVDWLIERYFGGPEQTK